MQITSVYSGFAKAASQFCGRPRTFVLALTVIALWIVTGPLFGFIDTWQLVINTCTTIITDETLLAFRGKYQMLASNARLNLQRGTTDTDTPDT